MAEALALDAATRLWSLADLTDEASFDRHLENVATAIADRFTLKVHQNVVARRLAFIAWLESAAADDNPPDYRMFVVVCANLIANLARHRIVSYSAMIRDPHNRRIDTILKYSNEVTALAAGAAIYSLRVRELTGEDPGGDGLSAMVLENAAASLHRHPEAAIKFRELLRLATPWT